MEDKFLKYYFIFLVVCGAIFAIADYFKNQQKIELIKIQYESSKSFKQGLEVGKNLVELDTLLKRFELKRDSLINSK